MSASTIRGVLPGIDKSLSESLYEVSNLPEILIVPCSFTGQKRVESVVEIIVPLAVQAEAAKLRGPHQSCIVEVALCDEVYLPEEKVCLKMDSLGQLLQERFGREIEDRVDGIDPERIHVKLQYPIEGIFYEEATNLIRMRPVKVDGLPPGQTVAIGKVWPKIREIVPFGAQMVVHNIQHDGETLPVTGIHQPFEVFRTAI
jgi:hypothetical protein